MVDLEPEDFFKTCFEFETGTVDELVWTPGSVSKVYPVHRNIC